MITPPPAPARIDVEAITAREQKATKGPWRINYHYPMFVGEGAALQRGAEIAHQEATGEILGVYVCRVAELPIEDFEFIAHARQDIPALLQEVARLQAELKARALPLTPDLRTALRIAKEATNGWACYAKRKMEHVEIARLHREIAQLSSPSLTPSEKEPT